MSVVLVVLQFLTLGPMALAAQNSTTDTRPLPDDSSASNVQVNRASPEQIKPDFSLHFSTPPKEEELEGVAMLPQPLAIIGHNPASSENAALGAALSVYFQQENKEDVRPFTGFLLEYPRSGWKASILANLGIIYRRHGYYTRALDAWNEAWQLSKDSNSVSGRAVADRSVAELARLLSSLGRTEQLKPLLAEIGHRPMYGAPASIILNAREGLAVMQREPGMSYKCGPYALGNVQKALHPGQHVDRAISLAQSPPAGFSLVQLTQLAEKINLKYQAAKRQPGTPFIVPSVVHWKSNHYAAIVGEVAGGGYLVKDPTFQGDVVLSANALEDECSGYFLIPSGPLPTGWTAVSDAEMKAVQGRGFPGPRTDDTTPYAKKAGCAGGESVSGGMATYSILSLLACLHIQDMPVGYTPPLGPDVHFILGYNQYEASQPTAFVSSNFGNNWISNWSSYVQAAPKFGGFGVTLTLRGGGKETYGGGNPYTGSLTQGSYGPQVQGQAKLYVLPTTNPVRTSSPADPNQLRYERHLPDGSVEVFDSRSDAQGNIFLTQVIDPQGNGLTLTYGTVSIGGQNVYRLASVTDAIGQTTTLSYGLSADPLKITKITDPFGRSATFTYTPASPYQLIQITDVINLTSRFSYAPGTDAITAMTTPYGTTTFSALSTSVSPAGAGADRTLLITDPQGGQEKVFARFEPDSDAYTKVEPLPSASFVNNDEGDGDNDLEEMNTYYWDKKAMMDAPNDLTKAHIDHWLANDLGGPGPVIYSEKNALESRIWYNHPGSYEPFHIGTLDKPSGMARLLSDGSTQLSQFSYNSLGYMTQAIDPEGRTTNYTYADNGIDLLTVKQVTGANTSDALATYTWNNQHEPLTYTDAAGETTTYTYNPQGQVATITDAKNEKTVYTYDSRGYLTAVDGPLPGTIDQTTIKYDGYGRPQTVTDGEGYTLTYAYDAADRVNSITYPDGTTFQMAYTNLDKTQETDRLGRITRYTYNNIRQLTSVTDPLSRVTQYVWCTCGALKKLVDPLGHVTAFTQDVEGRPISKTYADSSSETYTYDSSSNLLTSMTDGKGQVKSYSYNHDNTLAGIAYANTKAPTPGVTFAYDTNYNRLVSMNDGIGTTSYTYNPVPGTVSPGANQLAKVTGPWPNSTVNYAYDQLGRVLSRSINGVAQTVTYDAIGRMPSVANALGTFTYTYENASNRVTNIAWPNGQKTTASYFGNTGDRRLQQLKNLNVNGLNLSEFDYTYNAVGDILTWNQETDGNPTTDYTLAYDAADQLTGATATGSTYSYKYDTAANLLTQTVNGTTSAATYNVLNELQQVSPPLADNKTYTWDGENRLVGINYTGTSLSTQLSYDGLGRCAQIVEKNGSTISSTKRFIWCGLELCEEHDVNNNVARRFFAQGEQVSGAVYFYSRDHLGSTREMTDRSGTVQARYNYDPYGRMTKISGSLSSDFQYAGYYEHLASGLNLTLYRAYDPKTARWLSRDPIKEEDGINLYAYVQNNTISFVDPYGIYTKDWFERNFPETVDWIATHYEFEEAVLDIIQAATESLDPTGFVAEGGFNYAGREANRCSKAFKITANALEFLKYLKIWRAIRNLAKTHLGSNGVNFFMPGRRGAISHEQVKKWQDTVEDSLKDRTKKAIENSQGDDDCNKPPCPKN